MSEYTYPDGATADRYLRCHCGRDVLAGQPAGRWVRWRVMGLAGAYCPPCAAEIAAEDAARAAEYVDPVEDARAYDVADDARARARTRAGWNP